MSPAHERSDGIIRQIMAEFDEKHKKRLSHRPIPRVVHARAVVSCEVGYDFVEACASLPRPDTVLSIRKVALGTLVRARIKALLLLLRNKVSMQQGDELRSLGRRQRRVQIRSRSRFHRHVWLEQTISGDVAPATAQWFAVFALCANKAVVHHQLEPQGSTQRCLGNSLQVLLANYAITL